MKLLRRVVREPLVHFVALGGLLFAYFEWRGAGGPGSTRIVVTRGQIGHLASGFTRTWQRPPTEVELKGLVDDYVKDEIASREAVTMGLDRDDTIVRRRLRQKLEFIAEEAADQAAPTDEELKDWLAKHPAAYQAEPRIALRQVYLSTERRGASARAEAARLLERLRSSGPTAATDTRGDPTMLPSQMPLSPVSEVTRVFGGEFARAIEALPPGKWSGPIPSPFGLHLALVTEREAATAPTLREVRPLVERDFLAERRKAQLQALYDRLLQKYTVTTEAPKEKGAAQARAGER